ETVVGVYEPGSGAFSEVWESREITTGGPYVTVSGLDERGDCVLVGESFTRAPEIATVRRGTYRAVKSFASSGHIEELDAIERVECLTWAAPDGLQIQGWLLRPKGTGPHPLVMIIHGGPVSHWRPLWLGRGGSLAFVLLAASRGYALFFPNPRGSS